MLNCMEGRGRLTLGNIISAIIRAEG